VNKAEAAQTARYHSWMLTEWGDALTPKWRR